MRSAVPNVAQETDATCGAACVRAVLRSAGHDVAEKTLARHTRTRRDGCDPVDLIRALRHYRVRSTPVYGMTDGQLRRELARDAAVILGIRDDDNEGHWVVAVGCDARSIRVMDPWRGEQTAIAWADLAARWWDVEGRPPRPMVRFGLVVR
ncbi:MAG TPA: cysteine peptidase family C39 domain-containing protein [Kofleriaceae bacterium]